MFRRGLAQAIEHTNARLLKIGIQIRRFQVLRENFTTQNGLLRTDLSLDRVAITTRYRHLIDDMFQHQTDYPSKWIPDLPDAPLDSGREGAQSRSPERSVKGARDQANTGTADQDAAQASQRPPFSANNTHDLYTSNPREERYANYAREPSPRAYANFAREPSPRPFTREASPRQYTPRKSQPLPKSVRMLNMDGNSLKSPTARDRGRFLACVFWAYRWPYFCSLQSRICHVSLRTCHYASGNLSPQRFDLTYRAVAGIRRRLQRPSRAYFHMTKAQVWRALCRWAAARWACRLAELTSMALPARAQAT